MCEIISRLKEFQSERKWTDKDMADELGCSRQLWQMTRSGKIPLGNKILKSISTAFPDLEQDVKCLLDKKFLSNDANRFPKDATENPLKPPSQPQGGRLTKLCDRLLGWIWKLYAR